MDAMVPVGLDLSIKLSDGDISAIARAIAQQAAPVDNWLPTKLAAKELGLIDEETGEPKAELVRNWCRRGIELQPGKETRKLGASWQVNVAAVNRRLAKEQGSVRRVG
jgi:hypothetical protein